MLFWDANLVSIESPIENTIYIRKNRHTHDPLTLLLGFLVILSVNQWDPHFMLCHYKFMDAYLFDAF